MVVMTDLIQVNFNQSRIKTFNRCPKQYDYKYNQLLEPKLKSRPLFLGSWVHACLETFYRDGDWKIGHQIYVNEWNKLFDEEKLALQTKGRRKFPPLPEVVERIMRSYLWYYRDDGWTPAFVEQLLEVETPLKIDGKRFVFKGRLDLIIQDDEERYWLVDHKTASNIPMATSFHAMDPQLMLYPWAAKIQYGIDLAGIVYNYVKSTPPSIPKLNQNGSISRRKISTDYPTLYTFLKKNGRDVNEYAHLLRPLQKKSTFLQRYRLPREAKVTKEILLDTLSRVKLIDDITTRGGRFTRTITRECMQCSYHNICRAELNGFNTDIMRKSDFTIGEEDYVVGDHNRAEPVDEADEDDEGSEGD